MAVPNDRKYAESHEWHKLEDDGNVTLGLTKFAVDELTDVTFLELPGVSDSFSQGDSIGEVESVKATSDIYTGIAGEIVEVNEALTEDPSKLNEDPFNEAWLVKIKPEDPSQLESLMDAEAYEQQYPSE